MRKSRGRVPHLLVIVAGKYAGGILAAGMLAAGMIAACTPMALTTPVSPAATPVAPANGTPIALTTGSPGPGQTDAPGQSATATAANDGTGPSLTIVVDPPEVAWDSQSTVTVTASDPAGIKEIVVLLGDQLLANGESEELQLDFIPGAIDGLQGGTSYTLTARAIDLAGNAAETSTPIKVGPAPATDATGPAPASVTPAGTIALATLETRSPVATQPAGTPRPATPAPAATQLPGATQPPASAATPGSGAGGDAGSSERGETTYRVTEIQLPTYPYASYLEQTTDPERQDYPVQIIDRTAYEASNPKPEMQTHRLLVLENRYVRLGILPDLGGRIYEFTFKPTGANEFYANPVVKPTHWGPPSPPYAPGADWWLGTGGLEWGFPVEEHGYEFGTAWGFDHASRPDGGVMVTLFTKTGPENPYAVVDIILPPDTAYFVVQPRIVNPLGAAYRFKFWENAMLAPGKANSVSPDLRFIFPAQQVMVHSTGDPALPGAGQPGSWPVMNGKDLSKLGNWGSWLGLFAAPAAATPGTGAFAGVYDPTVDEGVVRVFPTDVARGVKLFAPVGLDPELWTDDGSTYVELHGGLGPTFADWYELGPGEDVTWSEFWYPVAGIGGATFANDRAALAITPASGGVRLGLFPTAAVTGRLTVTLPGSPPATFDVQISPDQPFSRELPLPAGAEQQGQVAVTLVDAGAATLLEWTGVAQLRAAN